MNDLQGTVVLVPLQQAVVVVLALQMELLLVTVAGWRQCLLCPLAHTRL
jgi:hypothetical protein